MSLSVCPGGGIDLQEKKKWQIPEGVRGEGDMVTSKIEPCIR